MAYQYSNKGWVPQNWDTPDVNPVLDIPYVLENDADYAEATGWTHSGHSDDYTTLDWTGVSGVAKPTLAQLQSKWDTTYKARFVKGNVDDVRRNYYPLIEDMVVAMWEKYYGSLTDSERTQYMKDIEASRQEIKTRFPK